MKRFKLALISSAVFFFASFASASAQEKINCPSIAIVENSMFTQAKFKAFIGWDLLSNNFTYEGREWNTLFGLATLDDVKNASEALKQGQTIFNTLALEEPTS